MDFVLTLQKEYRSLFVERVRYDNLRYNSKEDHIKNFDDFMRMEKDEEIIWIFADIDPRFIRNNIFLTNHGKIYYILSNTPTTTGIYGIMTELVYHNVLIPKNHITIIKTLLKNIIGSTRIEATPNDSLRWNNTNFDTIYKNLTELLESMKPPPPKEICKCDGVCYGACNAVYG